MYYAYNIFTLSMFMPLFRVITWRKIRYFPIVIVLIILFPYVYFTPYGGLAWAMVYIDKAMAYTFCAALMSYFLDSNRQSWFIFIRTGCIIAVLALCKSTGIFTASIAWIAVCLDMLYHCRGQGLKAKVKVIAPKCGLLGGMMLVAYLSWSVHLKIVSSPDPWSAEGINVSSIIALLTRAEERWRYDVIYYFIVQLFRPTSQYITGKLTVSYVGQVLLWLCMILLGAYISREGNGKKRILSALMLWFVLSVGYFLYLGAILISYLYVFAPEEALELASFTRYAAVYWFGAALFSMIYLCSKAIASPQRSKQLLGVLYVIIFTIAIVPVGQIAEDLKDPESRSAAYIKHTGFSLSERSCYKEAMEYLGDDDKVFILANDEFGWFLVAQYELIPADSNYQWEHYNFSGSADEWCEELIAKDYDYVWIEHANETFLANCGQLFDEEVMADSLYKISVEGECVSFSKIYSQES